MGKEFRREDGQAPDGDDRLRLSASGHYREVRFPRRMARSLQASPNSDFTNSKAVTCPASTAPPTRKPLPTPFHILESQVPPIEGGTRTFVVSADVDLRAVAERPRLLTLGVHELRFASAGTARKTGVVSSGSQAGHAAWPAIRCR